MASETITRNDLTNILNEVLPLNIVGITPDYGSAVSITSLPYTAPGFGIVIYTIGDGTNSGERNLTVNGVEIARARGVSGETTTVTALVSAGDIVSGTLGIWGTMRFVPYSLTMANSVNMFGNPTTVTLPYTATVDGIVVIIVNPSSSDDSYLYIKEGSSYHYEGSSRGGMAYTLVFPVKKGRTYSNAAASNAVITGGVRLYPFV